MTFEQAAKNFIFLMILAIGLLVIDLILWKNGMTTWSESIWEVNQNTLSFALGVGVVLGHCFTVPRMSK
ncbi:hypothetical protein UFOVP142_20 [uncultured Caudovirales phage]|uniref:Uncharacterized protein n=1 Tax=uncultured Caudovirales phage TaxID=2100421 RepID=A0A6J7XKM7_9CAUD|nr:hypothetical protein UFOVP142_20 [uncultured Caudovirales phage]